MRFSLLILLLAPSSCSAWTTVPSIGAQRARSSWSALYAIDYNDPVVAEEFAAVQPLTYEEVEEELQKSGIRPSAAMNEMDVKLMLVEMRMRLSGKLKDSGTQKKKPTKFSSKFEEAMWTKPAFEEFYTSLKAKDDINVLNVVAEYVNDPVLAEQRYGKTYRGVIRQTKEALTAPPPVKSTTISFSGFPANMGVEGCKMTLEALGPIVEFECEESDEFPILIGKVTYEDIESAKKAVAQYSGMDMGMGTQLELMSV